MGAALKYKGINRIGMKAPVSDFPSQKLWKYGDDFFVEWKKRGYYEYENRDGLKFKIPYSFYIDSQKYVMYDKVKNINCPVLIVHGDHDESVSLEQSKKIIKNFQKGTLVILRGADHVLDISGDYTLQYELFGDFFEGKEIKVPQPHQVYS